MSDRTIHADYLCRRIEADPIIDMTSRANRRERAFVWLRKVIAALFIIGALYLAFQVGASFSSTPGASQASAPAFFGGAK